MDTQNVVINNLKYDFKKNNQIISDDKKQIEMLAK